MADVKGIHIPSDQRGLVTSPNVQEAGECVARDTFPLDRVTVQLEFSYTDSELSDDNTGSDMTAQATLPQRSE